GVPLIFNSLTGNSNPFDPSHQVTPGGSFDATMVMMGYAKMFALGDRSAMAAIILPMGRISGDVTAAGRTAGQSASGFGDPMLEFAVNVIGPKAQRNIPDVLRYEPGFSMDILADLALPIGEYDSSQSLNIGQNRWYGRIGTPIVWQLGDWVPGRRTTLEFLPAVWLFGDNTDFMGQRMKTDPMFQLDAHLTRDFTEHFWGALDASWYSGGQASINGVAGKKLNNVGVGLTLGYTINSNLNLTVGYKSTINDSAPGDLRMDGFMISLVYGWHPLIEGMKRLKNE
ncbi:MAG: transporter, partial [Chloroflexi bacterium]|nr:transporter [Chloroflexota bacterium]